MKAGPRMIGRLGVRQGPEPKTNGRKDTKGEEEAPEKKCSGSITTFSQVQEACCSQQTKGEAQSKDRRP
tara:strand:- start:163 stop:369 length:207 start_codon:yes stop_codon:yes gene_type:complete